MPPSCYALAPPESVSDYLARLCQDDAKHAVSTPLHHDTPLQVVCKWDPVTTANSAVAKVLIHYGADPSVPRKWPPIALALHNHAIDVMEVLHAAGVRIPQEYVDGYCEVREESIGDAVRAYLVEKGYTLPEEEEAFETK